METECPELTKAEWQMMFKFLNETHLKLRATNVDLDIDIVQREFTDTKCSNSLLKLQNFFLTSAPSLDVKNIELESSIVSQSNDQSVKRTDSDDISSTRRLCSNNIDNDSCYTKQSSVIGVIPSIKIPDRKELLANHFSQCIVESELSQSDNVSARNTSEKDTPPVQDSANYAYAAEKESLIERNIKFCYGKKEPESTAEASPMSLGDFEMDSSKTLLDKKMDFYRRNFDVPNLAVANSNAANSLAISNSGSLRSFRLSEAPPFDFKTPRCDNFSDEGIGKRQISNPYFFINELFCRCFRKEAKLANARKQMLRNIRAFPEPILHPNR